MESVGNVVYRLPNTIMCSRFLSSNLVSLVEYELAQIFLKVVKSFPLFDPLSVR